MTALQHPEKLPSSQSAATEFLLNNYSIMMTNGKNRRAFLLIFERLLDGFVLANGDVSIFIDNESKSCCEIKSNRFVYYS